MNVMVAIAQTHALTTTQGVTLRFTLWSVFRSQPYWLELELE